MTNDLSGALHRLKSGIIDQEVCQDLTLVLKKNDPHFDTFEGIMDRGEKITDPKMKEMLQSFEELETSILNNSKDTHFANLLRAIHAVIAEVKIKIAEWYPKK